MSFSTQTTLPAFITPGWNDPPPNMSAPPPTAAVPSGGPAKSILQQRNRRPVDPSIASATTAVTSSPMGYASNGGAPAPTIGSPPLPQGGQNPSALASPGYNQWQAPQQQLVQQQQPQQPLPVEQHRPVYDAFAIRHDGSSTSLHSHFSTQVPYATPAPATTSAWTAPAAPAAYAPPTPPVIPTQPPLENTPSNIIYAPPNCEQRRPVTQPDPATWTPPVKAAGDVSLNGPQLVAFLTKASMRLPQVKCEGVQLRLSQLNEVVSQNRMSDACLKKLNFVVDAIDREQYEEAWAFFEQMSATFPTEMGGWSAGVKLLISEMRRPAERVGSAGSRLQHH